MLTESLTSLDVFREANVACTCALEAHQHHNCGFIYVLHPPKYRGGESSFAVGP